MLKNKRNLVLDLFDYSGNKLCSLYDNTIDAVGQAVNVFVNTERNGWKELNFVLPDAADGEDNYRIKSLKADYRIRLIDDDGIDWFVVSEPKITHNDFSKSVSVTAGHISQVLKTKNLGLEFNDDEGNNVGTAAQLLETILDGTGWTAGAVSKFYEKDGTTEKTRSLSAAAKTGAFSLVAKMCELFDAKPVYHGNEKTVDILPLNPFSLAANGLPDVADGNVLELHYGNNVKNVTRTMNTENMVTKLYAYGSFGDDVTGYCGIDEIKHKVLYFPSGPATANREYKFSYTDDAGMTVTKYFICGVNGNTKNITYSLLDPASRMYVYDSANNKAYLVYDTPKQTSQLTIPSATIKEEKNMFSFIMDFDYYKENDMLNDDMLQAIARYQAKAPALLETSNAAMTSFAEKQTELSNIIGTVDFCKLDVKSYGKSGSYVTLTLNKTTEHPDGVVYRTDYDKKKDKQFKWRVADAIKPNGDPTISGASVVYIVHNTTPVTWEKVCLKTIDNTDNPSVLTIWSTDIGSAVSTDRIYLFQTDNVNGYLGAYESANEANITALESSTKVVTTKHDVVFSGTTPSIPSVYGWWWNTSSHLMYFCYAEEGDTSWKRVYIDKNAPSVVNGAYFYNYEKNVLYHGVSGSWIAYETAADKRLASTFGSVWFSCMSRDKTYDGIYSKYEKAGTLAAGKYAIYNNYGSYWVFSTDTALGSSDKLAYDTTKQYVTATISGVDKTYEAKTYRFDSVKYHKANIVADANISDGLIDQTTGADKDRTGKRTSYMRAYPNVSYSASGYPSGTTIFFYDEKYNLLSKNTIAATNTSPNNTRYIRICSANNIASTVIYFSNYNSSIIIDEDTYIVLGGINGTGQLKGIIPFMGLFPTVADETYGVYRKAVDDAQAAVKALESEMNEALGDILREGYWQKADYVDGDEQKLYDDALENIEKVSKPDVKYTIDYLDLYGADDNIESDNMSVKYHWPDVNTSTAVHLVDPDIDTNTWAFVDKVQKCYDEPWKTQISINTNLSLIAQHTFTDVMKHIAEVASELNAKQTRYDKAIIQNGQGGVAADILQGQIDANTLKITGGSSTWYTDDKGNMIFVSADGMSAMTLTGNGFAIANSKNEWGDWNWRSFGTGEGFTADEIMTGVLRAGAVTILGSEQFYWDSNNIYIFDPTNQNRQIRIGQYNGADYGIGVTQDGGQTWQHAIDFDGVKFSGGIDDINGLRAVLEIQNGAIASKVSQDEFDELGNKVSTVETNFTQVPGMISTEIKKINVGGAQLLRGTQKTIDIVSRWKSSGGDYKDLTTYEYGDDYPEKRLRITDTNPDTTHRFGVKITASNLIVGNEYTFSANVINFGNQIRLGVDSINGEYETWANSTKRMSLTFTATSETSALYVACLWAGGTKDKCFDVWKLKLEAGNKPTDWNENTTELSTRITQTENEISLKASSQSVNDLTGRVEVAESEISLTPEKIDLAVKAINIGGAQLISGSNNTKSIAKYYDGQSPHDVHTSEYGSDYPDKWLRLSDPTSNFFRVYVQPGNLTVGTEYTFSVDVINFGDKVRIGVADSGSGVSAYTKWNNSVKRLSITFTATSANQTLRVDLSKDGGGGYMDVRKFKLEVGNKPTDWCENTTELSSRITQTAGAIELKADAVTVTEMGKSVTKAQQDVDAVKGEISSKVSQDVFNALGERVSTAESEISQTPTKITAAVKAIDIGGANLLKGTRRTIDILKKGNTASTFYEYGDDYPEKKVRVSNSSDLEYYVYVETGYLLDGKEYTFSVDVGNFGHNVRLRVDTAYSDWVKYTNSTKRLSLTFTAKANTNYYLRVICQKTEATASGYIDVRKFKLEYGNMATAWRDSDEEFRAGSSIEMTEDKVLISTPEFVVDLPSDNDLHMDDKGATMANLTVTRRFDAPGVASTIDGRTINVGDGQLYSTLSAVATEINNKTLLGNIVINLTSNITDNAVFKGIKGPGELLIHGQGKQVYGSIQFLYDTAAIVLYAIKITAQGTTVSPLYFDGCQYGRVTYETVNGATQRTILTGTGNVSGRRAIRAVYGSHVLLEEVEMYSAMALMEVSRASTMVTENIRGGDCTSFLFAWGGMVMMTGTRPSGGVDQQHNSRKFANLLFPADPTTLTVNSGTAPTPETPPTVVSVSTTSSTARTYTTSWFGAQDSIYQGYYGNVYHRAVLWFTNTSFSGKTIKGATLTLERVAGSGASGAVNVHLWGTPVANTSGGNPTTGKVDYGVIGQIENGASATLTVPTTAAQALASGSIKGLMLDPVDTVNSRGTSSNYTKFKAVATLKVTY